MAKSKYAPALFEMISKRQDARDGEKLSVPKWWRRGSPPTIEAACSPEESPVEEADGEPPADPETVEAPADTQTRAENPPGSGVAALTAAVIAEPRASSPELAPASDSPPPPPWREEIGQSPATFQVFAGRVAFSLSPVMAAVVAGVVVVGVFTAYELGHHSGFKAARKAPIAAATTDEVDRLLNESARPEVLKATVPQTRTRSNRACRTGEWRCAGDDPAGRE